MILFFIAFLVYSYVAYAAVLVEAIYHSDRGLGKMINVDEPSLLVALLGTFLGITILVTIMAAMAENVHVANQTTFWAITFGTIVVVTQLARWIYNRSKVSNDDDDPYHAYYNPRLIQDEWGQKVLHPLLVTMWVAFIISSILTVIGKG